jgi:MFS family permease
MSDDSPGATTDDVPGEPSRRLGIGVWSVGATSFFSDAGHEIATALLPSFVTGVLQGSAASLGAIEGVSDALTGFAKVAGGPLADDPTRRRRIAAGGYLGTAIATGAIGLTVAVWQVALLRGFAWLSRGLRSPARDSLLSSLTKPESYGRAFGVERAGDNLGAVVGPLLAAWLVTAIGVRPAIWFAAVPGVLAAVSISIAAVQARKTTAATGVPTRLRLISRYRSLGGTGIVRVLIPIAAFEAGNVATTLLILRGNQILEASGMTVTAAVAVTILIYAAHNAVAALAALGGGAVADRWGGRLIFIAGAAVYVGAYLGFAFGPPVVGWLAVFFVLAGCGIGFAETAESTIVARTVPENLRGTGFGALGLVQAGGDLLATVIAGVLFTVAGPSVAFAYAAAWMALAVLASAITGPREGGQR